MQKRKILTTILILLAITLAASGFILYGKGYRLNLSGEGAKILSGTGLLVLTSSPDGARVFIDDNLITATDDTINLPPGDYEIRIEKDGYYPWKKQVTLKKEAVTKTDAILYPTAPKLEAVTLLGAVDPTIDPTGSLVAYKVSSSSAENNGIYILSLGNRFIPFGNSSHQIVNDDIDEFSQSSLEFSPDGGEIIATVTNGNTKQVYLLQTDILNDPPRNITLNEEVIRQEWQLLQERLDDKFAATLPSASRKFIIENFAKAEVSPEGDKILYIASQSATMPHFINPSLPSTNSTQETRTLQQGSAYIYQVKEDKNYLLYSPQPGEIMPQFMWQASSSHLIFTQNKRIYSLEYDGGNKTTLYAGPFEPDFLSVWPDGSGVIILTNFNDETVPGNLYKIGLK